MTEGFSTFEMLFEHDDGGREPTDEDLQELEETMESYRKQIREEMGYRDTYFDLDDDDEVARRQEMIKPKDEEDAAADADAVKNVLEEIIQSLATKKICDVHHLDQQILTKLLKNLKNEITQETMNAMTELPASKKR